MAFVFSASNESAAVVSKILAYRRMGRKGRIGPVEAGIVFKGLAGAHGVDPAKYASKARSSMLSRLSQLAKPEAEEKALRAKGAEVYAALCATKDSAEQAKIVGALDSDTTIAFHAVAAEDALVKGKRGASSASTSLEFIDDIEGLE